MFNSYTVCPSCNKRVPATPGACLLCGAATSTTTTVYRAETKQAGNLYEFAVERGQAHNRIRLVLGQIEAQTSYSLA